MLRSKLSSLREYLTPINHSHNFSTTGEISPEEFVQAGDYLVFKFPTWQWSSCPKVLQKSFLPEDKQFLITKHVPSYQRASNYLTGEGGIDFDANVDEDGWVTSSGPGHIDKPEPKSDHAANDIDDFIDENAEDSDGNHDDDEFDDLHMISNANSTLRKYDMYITYSTSYRVPKMYLVGFNSSGIPLLPNQMFDDINADYKDKTATIESLPVAHNTTAVSIHPCKHSSVMKVLMKHSKSKAEDGSEGIRVDQYLVIFLKFIASVTPGIEYDYTMDAL